MIRPIITIDEHKCNGCGDCLPNCPEGAIQLIDGKARLVSDLATQVGEPSDLETPRPIGPARGAFEVPEAFFDPLPDALLEAFSGVDDAPHP